MTAQGRFDAAWLANGGEHPPNRVAELWFLAGYEAAARIVRQQRPRMRLVVGADGKHRPEVDLQATLKELHQALGLPCEKPSG